MNPSVKIGEKVVGGDYPTFIIAEVGINHNGSVELAKRLIDVAVISGCDAVKFQKRTPEICVPDDQKDIIRDTPWGRMTYLEYRHKIEFGKKEYDEIDAYCRGKGILWTASCWDEESVDFLNQYQPPFYKIASASLTDDELLRHTRSKGRPIVLSTGMSDLPMIRHAVQVLGERDLVILHCTSAYPSEITTTLSEILKSVNLKAIDTLRREFPNVPVGFSSNDTGLMPTYAACAMGACMVEKHITIYRAMWGSDHVISLEAHQLEDLCRMIRELRVACGDGIIRIYDEEIPAMKKLRRK